jgi:hypothetical protein
VGCNTTLFIISGLFFMALWQYMVEKQVFICYLTSLILILNFRMTMEPQKNNSNTIVIGYNILCLVCGFVAFKNYVPLDSLKGAVILGLMLAGYFFWFVYDTIASQNISFSDALSFNLKKNPAVWAMCSFWFVFICVPVMTNTLF